MNFFISCNVREKQYKKYLTQKYGKSSEDLTYLQIKWRVNVILKNKFLPFLHKSKAKNSYIFLNFSFSVQSGITLKSIKLFLDLLFSIDTVVTAELKDIKKIIQLF